LTAEIIQAALSEAQTFTAQGQGKEIEDLSRGKVIIFNDSNRAQSLVKNTRLLSLDGRLFRISGSVNVPAAGKVEIEAYADSEKTKGKQGDIQPTSFTIPGLSEARQKEVYAENLEAFTGGVKVIKIISAADILQAEKQFTETLENKGLVELNKKNSQISLKDITVEIKELKADAKAGDEKENFTISGKAVVYGALFDQEKLKQEASLALEKSLLDSQSLLSLDPAGFDYKIIEFNYPENIKIEAGISGWAILKDQVGIIQKDELIGLSKEEVQKKIMENKSATGVSVKLWPFWVTRVPRFKSRIEILIKPSDSGQEQKAAQEESDLEQKYLAP